MSARKLGLAECVGCAAALTAAVVVACSAGGLAALPEGAQSTQLRLIPPLPAASTAALVLAQFVFARQHIGRAAAALLAWLCALSPLLLASAALHPPDALAAAAQVTAAWVFFGLVRDGGWRNAALFVGVFAFALAVKERSAALALPLAVHAWTQRGRGRAGLAAAALALAAALGAASWIAGGGDPSAALFGASGPYARSAGSGSWLRYPVDLLLLSPGVVSLGCVALLVVAWSSRTGEREPANEFASLCCVGMTAFVSFGCISVRDVVAVDALLRGVLVGAALRSSQLGWRALAALVLVLCAHDALSFRQLFLVERIRDTATQSLLEARGMLPPRRTP